MHTKQASRPLFQAMKVHAKSWLGGLVFVPEKDVDGHAIEAEMLAQLVLEVALVTLLHQLGMVAKEEEGGDAGRDLGHVLDADEFAPDGGRLVADPGLLHDLVEVGGGDLFVLLLIDLDGGFEGLESLVHPSG